MATDKEKLDWLIANITYMEHKVKGVHPSKVVQGGYWPQAETDYGLPDPQLVGIDLDAYIESQLP